MADSPEYLVVGHLNKVHGTKGQLFAWPLTDHPGAVFAPGVRLHLGDADGRPVHVPLTELEIVESRPFRRGHLLRFRGVSDRASAERYAGRYLLRPFAEAVTPEDDEFFYHELLGLRVETVGGDVVGEIREVYEIRPEQLVEVTGPDRSVLLPLSRRVIDRIDREARVMYIDPPEGLLDL